MKRKKNGIGNEANNRITGVCPVEKAFLVDLKEPGGK
jgi:hypothetical protein